MLYFLLQTEVNNIETVISIYLPSRIHAVHAQWRYKLQVLSVQWSELGCGIGNSDFCNFHLQTVDRDTTMSHAHSSYPL